MVVPGELSDAIHEYDDAGALARWLDVDGNSPDDYDAPRDEIPWTLLMIAANHAAINCTRLLIARGANVNLANSRPTPNEHGGDGDQLMTPLHNAVAYFNLRGQRGTRNQLEIISLLLEAGARVDARNKAGTTPLGNHLYSHNPDPLIVAALLRAGASMDSCRDGRSAEGVFRRSLHSAGPNGDEALRLLESVRAAGGWKRMKRIPHRKVLMLRALLARNRATPRPTRRHTSSTSRDRPCRTRSCGACSSTGKQRCEYCGAAGYYSRRGRAKRSLGSGDSEPEETRLALAGGDVNLKV
mmetsp:Transcript_25613/g.77218  ORF Transcript_25613/g.77218 Transcript_25613/m.77218 type:complete len:298 (+) Transcript_25613:1455-2348(+)